MLITRRVSLFFSLGLFAGSEIPYAEQVRLLGDIKILLVVYREFVCTMMILGQLYFLIPDLVI